MYNLATLYMYSLAVAELATRIRKIGAEIYHVFTGFTDDRRVTKKAAHRHACAYIRRRVGLAKQLATRILLAWAREQEVHVCFHSASAWSLWACRGLLQ